MEKKRLRAMLLDRVSSDSLINKTERDRQVQTKLQTLFEQLDLSHGAICSGYRAMNHEINMDPICFKSQNSFVAGNSFKWVFPRIQKSKDSSHLIFLLATEGEFEQGAFGIWEPRLRESHLVPVDQIQLMLVPGLGFDPQGGRLGYGKAYYDKTLANFRGVKIGVTSENYLMPQIPMETTDIPMDFVVTEKNIFKVS